MTRIVRRDVQADIDQAGRLRQFCDRDRVYVVADVFGEWSEMGAWWRGEGERRVQRVLTEDGSVFDVESDGECWQVYRVWD